MRLSSARDLKQQILAARMHRARAVAARRVAMGSAAVAIATAEAVAAPPPLAIGIGRRGGEYKLAIRIVRATGGVQQAIDEIFAAAEGEAIVQVVGTVVKQQAPWHQARQRPIPIGSSVGHVSVTAGTVGAFVEDAAGDVDRPLLLSNNHVLANENAANVGDLIIQPGDLDGGQATTDGVATLLRFERLQLGAPNRIDAAVAQVSAGVAVDETTLAGLGSLRGVRVEPLDIDERVFKLGRTTGLTEGRVEAIEVDDLSVLYDHGTLTFDGQIEIEPVGESAFSLGGDSGSLIVDADLDAVGLLFAGNDVDKTYANPIADVMQALAIRF